MDIEYYILRAGKFGEPPEFYEDASFPDYFDVTRCTDVIEQDDISITGIEAIISRVSTPDRDSDGLKRYLNATGSIKFAVADGATTGSYCRDWAKILVNTFGTSEEKFDAELFYICSIKKWNEFSSELLAKSNDPFDSQAIYETGAFSTFLGLDIEPSGDWKAYAIGDSTLFHIRDGKIIASFILTGSDQYGIVTQGLSSLKHFSKNPWQQMKETTGTLQNGDQIFLMTDALSQWFLNEFENGRSPWDIINDFGRDWSMVQFTRWVAEEQKSKNLENDDITAVCINISGE